MLRESCCVLLDGQNVFFTKGPGLPSLASLKLDAKVNTAGGGCPTGRPDATIARYDKHLHLLILTSLL